MILGNHTRFIYDFIVNHTRTMYDISLVIQRSYKEIRFDLYDIICDTFMTTKKWQRWSAPMHVFHALICKISFRPPYISQNCNTSINYIKSQKFTN